MSVLIDPTQLQLDIQRLNGLLDTIVYSVNAASSNTSNFYYTLWTGLSTPQLSAVLNYMYQEGVLFEVLDNYVTTATNINAILSAWNFPGVYSPTLSAGKAFTVQGGVVVLTLSA